MLVAGLCAAIVAGHPGGVAAFLGSAGLVAFVLAGGVHSVRRYRAGRHFASADMRVRRRPVFHATTLALALALPLAASYGVIAALRGGWIVVAGVLLVGCAATLARWLTHGSFPGEEPYRPTSRAESTQAALHARGHAAAAAFVSPAARRPPGRRATASTSLTGCSSCSTTASSRPCSRTSSPTSPTATRP